MEVGNWVQLLESLRTENIEFFAADVRDMPRDAALDIQLIGGQPANLYVRAGHPLAGREHTLQEVWAYGLAVPTLLSPSTVELAALMGLPQGQEATIALECDNYGMLKTVALTTDTVLGATDAAVQEELESGALVRLVVQGWLSPPSSTGIVRLRGRTSSPAAKAAIAAIVRAAVRPEEPLCRVQKCLEVHFAAPAFRERSIRQATAGCSVRATDSASFRATFGDVAFCASVSRAGRVSASGTLPSRLATVLSGSGRCAAASAPPPLPKHVPVRLAC
jgi:hypothetical protein